MDEVGSCWVRTPGDLFSVSSVAGLWITSCKQEQIKHKRSVFKHIYSLCICKSALVDPQLCRLTVKSLLNMYSSLKRYQLVLISL